MRGPVIFYAVVMLIAMAGCGGEGPMPESGADAEQASASAAEYVPDRVAKVMDAVRDFVDAQEKGPEKFRLGEPVFEGDGAYLDVLVGEGDESRSVRISLGFEAGEWAVKSSTFQQDSDSPRMEMHWKKAEAGTYVFDLDPYIEDELAKAVRRAGGAAEVEKLEFSNALGPHGAAIKAFLERYKDVYVAPDYLGLKALFYFSDPPLALEQASMFMEAKRLTREIAKVTFELGDHAGLVGQPQGVFEGDNYVANIELIGVFRRVFVPLKGFEDRAKDWLGVKDGVCYFPGLTKASG